jgi:peptide/nickel transport system permease protein
MATPTAEFTTGHTEIFYDEDISLIKRILRGRRWYGTEWYITVFGGLILVTITVITLLASYIAPYDPNAFVGSQFIPPGGGHQSVVTRAGQSHIVTGGDLTSLHVGTQRNRNGTNTAVEMGLEYTRYQTQDEMVNALLAGEVDAALLDEKVAEELVIENPGLEVASQDLGRKFALGTDNLGRDILSRLIWGARTVLGVAFLSALISSGVGISLGLVSGFVSGPFDRVISLVMDSVYSFPGLLLAIAMATMLGPGLLNVAVAISVIYIPTFFRVVRGQVLSIKEQLFIEAARSLGAKSFSILTRYIFPNVIPSVVVVFSLNIADAILTEAGLSFIGLGLPPDIPDWGYDLSKGHSFLVAGHWWMITLPGVMITTVAMGFSLLGEGLSEILNPRLVKG